MGFSKLKIPRVCPQCGNPFEAKTVTTMYCSPNCVASASKFYPTKNERCGIYAHLYPHRNHRHLYAYITTTNQSIN